LANKLGDKLNIPVYHRDQISWKKNWEARSNKEQIELVREISVKDKWIFDGNRLTASKKDGRLERCDTIINLEINRFICLCRGLKRYFKHSDKVRDELPEGCEEEYDMQVVKYVLFDYPKKRPKRKKFFDKAEKAGKNVIRLNSVREVNA
jgi:adenylate kinase family enzyme